MADTFTCSDDQDRHPCPRVLDPPQTETIIVSEKKAYPLRINSDVLDAMQRWSNDELRSLNAQIEYVLREALRKNGRLKDNEPVKKPVE